MKTTQPMQLHEGYDKKTSAAVKKFNDERQRLLDADAAHDAEGEKIAADALDALEGKATAEALVERAEALQVARIQTDIDALSLPALHDTAHEAVKTWWQSEAERRKGQEDGRREQLDKVADELGYDNPSRERTSFVVQDVERRRLEQATKEAKDKANHLRQNFTAELDSCRERIKKALHTGTPTAKPGQRSVFK